MSGTGTENGQQHRQGLVWLRRCHCPGGLARLLALAVLSPAAYSSRADTGTPVFLNLSCRAHSQNEPLLLPSLLHLVHSLTHSGFAFILYVDHLEPLTESNNNQQRAPGIAKLDLLGVLFFPSLKDPLIGQNQFQTTSVPPGRLTRHCSSPDSPCEPHGPPGGKGETGFLPSQTPHFVNRVLTGCMLNACCSLGLEEERRNEVTLFLL